MSSLPITAETRNAVQTARMNLEADLRTMIQVHLDAFFIRTGVSVTEISVSVSPLRTISGFGADAVVRGVKVDIQI